MYPGYLFGSLKDLMSKISKGTAKWPRFDGSSIFSYACDVVSHDIGKMSNYGPGVQELIFRGVFSLDASRHARHEVTILFISQNANWRLTAKRIHPCTRGTGCVVFPAMRWKIFWTFKKAIADFSAGSIRQSACDEVRTFPWGPMVQWWTRPSSASQSHFLNTLWFWVFFGPALGSFTHTFTLHHDHCAAVVGLEIFEGHSRSHFCLRWDARNPNQQWTISVEHWNWEQNHTSNKEQGYSSPTSSSPDHLLEGQGLPQDPSIEPRKKHLWHELNGLVVS